MEISRLKAIVEVDANRAERNLGSFDRRLDQSARKAESASGRISGTFKKDLADLDKDFERRFKKLDADFDKFIRKQEQAKQKAATISRGSSGGRGSFSRELGQALEEFSRGDVLEGLTQLSAGMGKAGTAIAAVGLVAVGAAVGLAALSKHVIENVRDVERMAVEHKRTTSEIQALQLISRLTGQSVGELAERFNEISPRVREFEKVVKDSGAALDQDLRNKTREAAFQFEVLKLELEGVGNEIARGFFPYLTNEIQRLNQEVNNGSNAWQNLGQSAGAALAQILGSLKQLAKEDFLAVLLTPGGTAIKAYNAGVEAREKAKREQADQSYADLYNPPKPKDFPILPPKPKAGRSGSGSSDRDAAFRAELDLRRAQADALAEIDKQGIRQAMEAEERALAERLRFNGSNYADNLKLLEDYYAQRLALQQRNLTSELQQQLDYQAILSDKLGRAKKPSERLQIEAESTRINARITTLESQINALPASNQAEAQRRIREEQEKLRDLNISFTDAYKKLQTELSGLTETDLERFQRELDDTVAALERLAIQTGRSDGFDLAKQFRAAATQRFRDSQLPQQFDTESLQMELERQRVQALIERGVISEGSGRQKILEIERAHKQTLVDNLNTQIAILEAQGRQNEALRLRQQLEDIERNLGVNTDTFTERLKGVGERFGQAFDQILSELIQGQITIGDALRGLAKSFINDFFQTLQQSIIEGLTGEKSIGALLGKIVGGFLSGLLGGGRASGGPVWRNRIHPVGEEGPEFFVPRQDGWIVNQRQASLAAAAVRGGASGIVNNFSIVVNAPDKQTAMMAERSAYQGVTQAVAQLEAVQRRRLTN